MSRKLSILQMRARPSACGVTDHSLTLAGEFRRRGIQVRLLSTGNQPAEGFEYLDIRAKPAIDLDSDVLVQLSAYGFDPRGIPVNLEQWLRALRQPAWRGKLIIFFHETWAPTWQPWRSAFWYCPFQKQLCARLAAMADIGVFNSVVMLRWGQQIIGEPACVYSPVFSNVGEPAELPAWSQRSASCVAFGSSATRARAYQVMQNRLPKMLKDWGVEEVIDIGNPLPVEIAACLRNLPIRFLGALPASAVSAQLLSVQLGLFGIPWGLASKSGVYAAYQSHGVVPVSVFEQGDSRYLGPPGPVLGEHFSSAARPLSDWQRSTLSTGNHQNYRLHTASRFCEQLVRNITNF